ncbi:MAG: hypothetical protein LRZ84_01860 [Desertifilum sp.]|nr:hypothetical protein [Desertifilum sp.]
MSSMVSSLDVPFQRLRELRGLLLRLHKILLHSEKTVYEQNYGSIRSHGEFFKLVLEDEWFSWLRPISQFIVEIDEALSAKEPVTLARVNELLDEAQTLLRPAEAGTIPEQRYYQAIQREPDVALMHAEVSRLLKQKR